jgi:hypothetical protein
MATMVDGGAACRRSATQRERDFSKQHLGVG